VTASLVVHVVPRARATGVAGRHRNAIRVRVAELARFLAQRFGVRPRAVVITAGIRGRRKVVAVEGLTTHAALRLLLEGGA
jgi:uncharacterized protein YggU (UPF0235/DUF167 family)